MTSEQRVIAWVSCLLVLFAIWRLYRPTLSKILFDTPPGSQGILQSIGSAFVNVPGELAGDAAKGGETALEKFFEQFIP